MSEIRSPLKWPGGKRLLAKAIVKRIPPHDCYCEPFAGGAHVFFRKAPSKSEVLNDVNKELITFYRVVQNHFEEFIRCFQWSLVSRDEFERLKKIDPETLTDIQRAARFYYLQKCSFGGRFNNPSFGYGADSECLKRYDKERTFFYLDPPYWGSEDYYGKGTFRREEFAELAEALCGIKGRFLLSINACPQTREIFGDRGFVAAEVETTYSLGGTTINGAYIQKASEVFFMNYVPGANGGPLLPDA